MKSIFNIKIYIKYFLNKTIEGFSPIIKALESRLVERYANQTLKHQPVFIIGAPRTGSTILYQTLTNLYDVLYVNNLVCMFNKNIFFGFWLSNKIFGDKPHNNFESYRGRTKGLHSPSECGQFWYRWLPMDHHFIDYNDITPRIINEIQREITAVINYFDKPILFKNLNAGQRIRLITQCFPKAVFLFITRDPVQTAQSILNTKRCLGLDDNSYWSIMPPNVQELKNINGYEQVVKQVYYLEKQIVEDSFLSAKGSFYYIHYEDLSLRYIEELAIKLGFKKRKNPKIPNICVNEKRYIKEIEYQILQKHIKSLDWSFIQDRARLSPNKE